MTEIYPNRIDMAFVYWCGKCGRLFLESAYLLEKNKWKNPKYLKEKQCDYTVFDADDSLSI